MGGAAMMTLVLVITAGITAYLIGTMIRSISNERRTSARLWKNFGLSLGFCALFLISWLGHGIAEWQVFTDEQVTHGQQPEIGDFIATFMQSTLENWQSEFLQLFSFTVMAAVLIHKGSAESRDSDDLMLAALKRVEDKLGTELTLRDDPVRRDETLYVVPDEGQGWALRSGAASEPEGYFDSQDEAIAAGRLLAAEEGVDLVVRGQDATVQEQTS